MPRKQSKWFNEFVPEEIGSSSLFKFAINIGDKRIEVDMRADLDIDYSIIQTQLEDTPSEYAYWAAIYSELKMRVAKLERSIKVKRGQLISTAVKEASEANLRLTDKQVQAIIEADDELNKLESILLLAEKHAGKMWFMVDAIKMKSENLRSLSGFAKTEMAQSRQ